MQPERTLRGLLRSADDLAARTISGSAGRISLRELAAGTSLGGHLPALSGRSVLLAMQDQLTAALALIELDGIASRMILCPPGLPQDHLVAVAAAAEAEMILRDAGTTGSEDLGIPHILTAETRISPGDVPNPFHETEWVLLTSGTTGPPKLVLHSLASLTGAIKPSSRSEPHPIWATFYDIRRYGGLQILLRALLNAGSMVLSGADETPAAHLARLGGCGITHISGTPSHWRRALMSGAAQKIAPRYIRLSGEIVDQAILDNLRATYPQASVGHAYASTEAGVGFDVNDGLEGFPASYLEAPDAEVEMKIEDGSLRIRSQRTASNFIGVGNIDLKGGDGFIDTGDIVERRGDRCYFVGRRGGIVNVGGLKVHPEEVESVINAHPDVRMSLVSARRNPITGAIVVADVVLAGKAEPDVARRDAIKTEILDICRESLAQHKVPVTIRFVPGLEVTAGGKLRRAHA